MLASLLPLLAAGALKGGLRRSSAPIYLLVNCTEVSALMDTRGDQERLKLLVALPSGRLVGRKGLGPEGAAFLEHLAHKRHHRAQAAAAAAATQQQAAQVQQRQQQAK